MNEVLLFIAGVLCGVFFAGLIVGVVVSRALRPVIKALADSNGHPGPDEVREFVAEALNDQFYDGPARNSVGMSAVHELQHPQEALRAELLVAGMKGRKPLKKDLEVARKASQRDLFRQTGKPCEFCAKVRAGISGLLSRSRRGG